MQYRTYWSVLSFPTPGDLPDSGIEPGSPALQADSSSSELPGKPQGGVGVSMTMLGSLLVLFSLSYGVYAHFTDVIHKYKGNRSPRKWWSWGLKRVFLY